MQAKADNDVTVALGLLRRGCGVAALEAPHELRRLWARRLVGMARRLSPQVAPSHLHAVGAGGVVDPSSQDVGSGVEGRDHKTDVRGVLEAGLLASLVSWRSAARDSASAAPPMLHEHLGYGLDEVRDLLAAHPGTPPVRDPVQEAMVPVSDGSGPAAPHIALTAAAGSTAVGADASMPVTTLWSTNALIATALYGALQPCVRAIATANPGLVDAAAAAAASRSSRAGTSTPSAAGSAPVPSPTRSLFDLAALLGPHNEVSAERLAATKMPPLHAGPNHAARGSGGGRGTVAADTVGGSAKRARLDSDDVAAGTPDEHPSTAGDAAGQGIRTTREMGAASGWEAGDFDSDLDLDSDGERDDSMVGGAGAVGRAVSSADRRRDSWLGNELADAIAGGSGGGSGVGRRASREDEGSDGSGGCAVM